MTRIESDAKKGLLLIMGCGARGIREAPACFLKEGLISRVCNILVLIENVVISIFRVSADQEDTNRRQQDCATGCRCSLRSFRPHNIHRKATFYKALHGNKCFTVLNQSIRFIFNRQQSLFFSAHEKRKSSLISLPWLGARQKYNEGKILSIYFFCIAARSDILVFFFARFCLSPA